MMYERLNRISGVSCSNAQGAFYLLLDISSYLGCKWEGGIIRDSFDMATYLLEKAKVAVVSGDSFRAPNCLRLSYSNSIERIRDGLNRMEIALAELEH